MAASPAGTLVDSNVLLDVLTEDPKWFDWSAQALAEASDAGPLLINRVIYAEVSVRFSQIEEMEAAFPPVNFRRVSMPWEAAFLAGKAFVNYRKRGGTTKSPLPDFFIGAHAAVDSITLLTRDASRFAAYFPTVQIIHP